MTKGTGKLETNPVTRLLERNLTGLRARINAMCATCVGVTSTRQGDGFIDYQPPGWRTEICGCTVLSCPLHPVRPFQKLQ